MQRWSFNYKLFFKKNMAGLLVLALFGVSAVSWDKGLLMKSIALSEIMPGGKVSVSMITEIYAAEKEHKVIVQTNNENSEESKETDEEKNTGRCPCHPLYCGGSIRILPVSDVAYAQYDHGKCGTDRGTPVP